MRDVADESSSFLSGRRVLVVDDEAGIREMLSLVLSRNGYAVTQVADGQQALDQLREGNIDIVLTDVRMPQLDGIALLRTVQDLKLPVLVIVMSAFVDLETAIEALKMGASDYVSKPFRADEVLLKIRVAMERQRLEEERERLRAENARLRTLRPIDDTAGLIGKSPCFLDVLTTVQKIADYKSTVLLIGESGTGKELIAKAVHHQSIRKSGPYVAINCGAIPDSLLESELFGHVKGAFTDASRDKVGLIEEANGGTLFLDEIGELPLALQVKLLRFLQEDEIRRVGDTQNIQVDVRVVAATARDLQAMVAAGSFREDLYYRLNVLQIKIPPLRKRKEDIPALVEHFISKYGKRLERGGMGIAREALRVLMDYHWPGNIRELENVVERAMVLSDSDQLDVDSLPEKLRDDRYAQPIALSSDELSIKRAIISIERQLIAKALEKTKGNRTRAAELLEISHRALLYKIKRYGLD